MRLVLYRGLPHEVVEERSEIHLIKGKDWGTSILVSSPECAPYYHLRCYHAQPCREVEYVKKVRARSLRPGKKGSSPDDYDYYDTEELKCSWVSCKLCEAIES